MMTKQECIPVGCVQPAAVAIRGGLHQTPPWTRHPLPDQASPWDQTPPTRTRHPLGSRHPTPRTRNPLPPGEDTPHEQTPPCGQNDRQV